MIQYIIVVDMTDDVIKFRHSIVASIPACHAGDQGSIPCDGELPFALLSLIFYVSSNRTDFVIGRATLNIGHAESMNTANHVVLQFMC